MKVEDGDPLHQIAERVAYCFAESGYAFVEEDKIDGLAAILGSFLTVAGIPVNPPLNQNSLSLQQDDSRLPAMTYASGAMRLLVRVWFRGMPVVWAVYSAEVPVSVD